VISDSLLIGDLGATNARFALARHEHPGFSNERTLKCAEHPSPLAALNHYLEASGVSHLSSICLAVAAPVASDVIRFINNDWQLNANELRKEFAPARVQIINDFKAAAYAIPLLGNHDLLSVGGPAFELEEGQDFSVGKIGPGSGLGVSGLVKENRKLQSISGEGGHQGFSPHSRLQLQVFEVVRRRFGRTSNERLISGPGIENIYSAMQEIFGQQGNPRTAADIMQRAIEGSDEAASSTESLFFEILGQVAGDLALLIGAYDGVLIGGGIVKRYPQRLLSSRFREGFENKGRHGDLMKNIPTCLVTHPNPGLLGASHLAQIS